jgi:hypothetical protein
MTYTAEFDGGQGGTETIEADSIQEALEKACESAKDGDYAEALENGTIWVDVTVTADEEDGETLSDPNYAIDPPEPRCGDNGGDHVWASPLSIVGGCKENPGVYGHGGGITSKEVCLRCGCEEFSDSWAQNRDNGMQGLDSVSYTPRKYEDEVDALLAERVEFKLQPALDEDKYLIIASLDYHGIEGKATYEVEADTDGYSANSSDTDTWPGCNSWPDPPQSMIDEAREIVAA